MCSPLAVSAERCKIITQGIKIPKRHEKFPEIAAKSKMDKGFTIQTSNLFEKLTRYRYTQIFHHDRFGKRIFHKIRAFQISFSINVMDIELFASFDRQMFSYHVPLDIISFTKSNNECAIVIDNV